jgi:hypothetical protein
MLVIESLLVGALLLGAACGLGVRVSLWLRLRYTSLLDLVTFVVGLGFACFIGLGFFLGAVGLLTPPVILGALLGLTVIGLISLRRSRQLIVPLPQPASSFPGHPLVQRLGQIFLAILIGVNLIGALAPEVIWDAHSYHLNLAQQWLTAGSLVHVPYNFYSTWPLNLSILYALEMGVIRDSALPQLTHFALGVLSLLLIYNYLRPRYGKLAAILGGVVFYSIPVMSWLSTTAISDLGIAYFTLAAVVACLRWIESEERAWLILAAIETGLAMGAKLTGLFTLAVLILAIVYIGFVRRTAVRRIVAQGALAAAIALALAAPWYLKSYLQTGNPIFPFGYTVFGGTNWTDRVNTSFLAQQFGYGGVRRTLFDYLLLPLRLLIPQHNPYEGPLSWMFLAGVVWGIVQRHNRTIRYLAVYALITFGFWMFFTTQQVRMLLPAVGAVSIVLGMGLSMLAARFRRGSLIVTIVMLLIIAEGSVGVWRERSGILADQVRVVAGTLSREAYLRTYLEPADVILFANRNLPPGGAILSRPEIRSFLSEHEFIWGASSIQAYLDYSQLKAPTALRKRLRDLGIQYVLLKGPAPELESLRPELQLIYKSGQYDLYRWDYDREWISEECYAAAAQQSDCLVPGEPQATLGEIVPGTKLFQTFTSECAGLNRLRLFLTSYDRTNTGTLQVRLKDLDAEQQLFDIAIPAAEIANNQWHEVSFEPLPDSRGRQYRITLAAPGAEPGNAFGIWRSDKDVYPGGTVLINNKPIQSDWVFQYGCGR